MARHFALVDLTIFQPYILFLAPARNAPVVMIELVIE
jgi:hypothetical protein